MPASPSRLRRAAAAATVAAGLGLLGMSAAGIAALRSDLEAASRPAAPSRLIEEDAPPRPWDDHRCPRRAPLERPSAAV